MKLFLNLIFLGLLNPPQYCGVRVSQDLQKMQTTISENWSAMESGLHSGDGIVLSKDVTSPEYFIKKFNKMDKNFAALQKEFQKWLQPMTDGSYKQMWSELRKAQMIIFKYKGDKLLNISPTGPVPQEATDAFEKIKKASDDAFANQLRQWVNLVGVDNYDELLYSSSESYIRYLRDRGVTPLKRSRLERIKQLPTLLAQVQEIYDLELSSSIQKSKQLIQTLEGDLIYFSQEISSHITLEEAEKITQCISKTIIELKNIYNVDNDIRAHIKGLQ